MFNGRSKQIATWLMNGNYDDGKEQEANASVNWGRERENTHGI